MNRPRSPIEIMVDRACGFDADTAQAVERIELRCPTCAQTRRVAREPQDPDGARVVEITCPKCIGDAETVPVVYRDANGAVIPS